MTEDIIEKVTKLRRHLHQYPELSCEERETSKTVQAFLQKHAMGKAIPLTDTGFMWEIDSGKPGKVVTIRAELDALPIPEENTFTYKSTKNGVSHKCGHDGHTSILCGTVLNLSKEPPASGKYQFLFQPAEENGEGARAILEHSDHEFYTDYIFALHNLPGFDFGQVIYKSGTFTPAVKSIIIYLKGKTSHAAEPENGINPALAMAEILQLTDALNINQPELDDFQLVTPIEMNLGEEAYGISAGYGEIRLTLRAWNDHILTQLGEDILDIVRKVSAKYQLKADTEWTQIFSSNQNDEQAVSIIESSARENDMPLLHRDEPFKWGEDFGLFTQHFKGAMFGLGAGKDVPSLHNPDYDYPDALTKEGIRIFSHIMRKAIS